VLLTGGLDDRRSRTSTVNIESRRRQNSVALMPSHAANLSVAEVRNRQVLRTE
jgi:hypothetical protein